MDRKYLKTLPPLVEDIKAEKWSITCDVVDTKQGEVLMASLYNNGEFKCSIFADDKQYLSVDLIGKLGQKTIITITAYSRWYCFKDADLAISKKSKEKILKYIKENAPNVYCDDEKSVSVLQRHLDTINAAKRTSYKKKRTDFQEQVFGKLIRQP